MASLLLTNTFDLVGLGLTLSGKQGSVGDGAQVPFLVSVDGLAHYMTGSLPAATAVVAWDDDTDVPADWNYLYLWADQAVYVQLIGSGSNVVLQLTAKVPFTLAVDSLLAAANTTPIASGVEPTLTDIDSVVIGNYAEDVANYLFAVID